MKRFANYLNNQLVFNETTKAGRYVEQKTDEAATVRAFERKYRCELEYKTFRDGEITWKGYAIKSKTQEVA